MLKSEKVEYREVKVAIGKHTYEYYMTNDLGLLGVELKKLDCILPKQGQWCLNKNLSPDVAKKMNELCVCYSLCKEADVLNYYKDGKAYIVFLRFLKNPDMFVVVARKEFKDLLTSYATQNESLNSLVEVTRKYVEKIACGLGMLQEYMGLKADEIMELHYAATKTRSGRKENEDGVSVKKDFDFAQVLRKLRDQNNMTDAQVYKKAGISRQVYSNIISGKAIPKRETVISLAIAFKLGLADTNLLLSYAGHSFLPEDAFSSVIKDCINLGKDLEEVNEKLNDKGLKLLGDVLK